LIKGTVMATAALETTLMMATGSAMPQFSRLQAGKVPGQEEPGVEAGAK
jgi:hypothetical protein